MPLLDSSSPHPPVKVTPPWMWGSRKRLHLLEDRHHLESRLHLERVRVRVGGTAVDAEMSPPRTHSPSHHGETEQRERA